MSLTLDGTRILQLLQNLVENAIQHAPQGSRVRLLLGQEVRDGLPTALLEVTDEGPGFRAEDLARVFEPFFTRRQGGTGLGLAIASRIVAEHAGEIEAANQPGGGARLTVHLPLTAA